MIRSLICAAACAACAVPASAAPVVEVFLEADVATAELTFLEAVTSDGTTAYAVLRDTTAADVGGVQAFSGGVVTPVSTPTDYAATGSTNDLALGNGFAVVGNVLRGVSFFDNNVYEVDLGTGAVTEVVSAASIDAAAGVSANLSASFETTADGTIYSVESVGDQVLAISPGNAVSVEIDPVNFAAANGGTSIGGIGVLGDTILLGSNSLDALIAWDTVTDTFTTVLTTAEIEAATDDIDGTASFGDIFAAPDGLVYFYEGDSDHLLAYNPSAPASSLTAIITEQEFTDGPSSDTINQLTWFEGNIAFTDGGIGFYTIPEPTTALLGMIALVGFGAARRR
ncbi:MAG: hypothetical protein AAF266_02500 [Planctomycetota bacterium]